MQLNQNISLSRPTARKNALLAYHWANTFLSTEIPRTKHSSLIRAVFGNYSDQKNKTAQWLYANLLIQTGTYLAQVKSYEYYLNERGRDKLKLLLEVSEKSEKVISQNFWFLLKEATLNKWKKEKLHNEFEKTIKRSDKCRCTEEFNMLYKTHQLVDLEGDLDTELFRIIYDYSPINDPVKIKVMITEMKTGKFTYTGKHNGRQFNNWQKVSAEGRLKALELCGFKYHADISAALPTIMLHLANQTNAPEPVIEAITDFIINKHQWREHVASLLNKRLDGQITEHELNKAKAILAAIWNGSHISPHPKNTIHNSVDMCEGRVELTRKLMADQKLRQLRRKLTRMRKWVLPMHNIDNTLKHKTLMSLYSSYERQVMDIVAEAIQSNSIFYVFDGFSSTDEFDYDLLNEVIYKRTGIKINFTDK